MVSSAKVEQHDRRKAKRGRGASRSATSGCGRCTTTPTFRFGLSSDRDEWDAKRTLRGSYSTAEQQPDADLGKHTAARQVARRGRRRRRTRQARVWVCPRYGTTAQPPAQKSVANAMNYGDEGSSKQLLYPPPYACVRPAGRALAAGATSRRAASAVRADGCANEGPTVGCRMSACSGAVRCTERGQRAARHQSTGDGACLYGVWRRTVPAQRLRTPDVRARRYGRYGQPQAAHGAPEDGGFITETQHSRKLQRLPLDVCLVGKGIRRRPPAPSRGSGSSLLPVCGGDMIPVCTYNDE